MTLMAIGWARAFGRAANSVVDPASRGSDPRLARQPNHDAQAMDGEGDAR